MQISVESGEGLKRKIKVQVPSERVDEQVDKKLREMRGQVRLQGFRPGKVPMKVVQKRYGPQVRGEVLDEVVRTTYAEALQQESLRPAGAPDIQPLKVEAGEDLEYEANFEVMPDIEVSGIESIELQRPAVDIETADVDRILERLRKQHAEHVEVERAAESGDQVTIDFEGKVDGEDFDGNSGEDVPVPLGEGQMPEPFEKQLIGMKAGDEKTVKYTFPEGFPDETIAGKEAVFSVTLKKVEAPELPAADDTFAETLGIEGGLEALRERISDSLEREREQAVRARVKNQVMEALVEKNEIDLPQTLVDGEIEQLREQTRERMKQAGAGDDEPDLPSDQFEQEARRRVSLGLLVNEIVRSNEIELDHERMQQALQRVAAGYEQPEQIMQHYLQNQELMQSLQLQVMEDQVVDWVMEQAQVTDKPMSLDALTSGVEDDENAEAG
ncbi:trigger factor [Spiribacter salinus]|jgi:trigger factor|uniref:Trigger factor n=1 Tax=Spiribacter salinus TaxID=1335746 RepID=A0A540VRC4_9GAMM|nr:trigger factor [Spiribacter salinus]MBY5267891.1 trigger factor [Spiribacter salinus]MDR9454215.1 trigger factor [Spiribacter sp.]TQE99315.1 MAG: trigger factor [Spiribacter salinus]